MRTGVAPLRPADGLCAARQRRPCPPVVALKLAHLPTKHCRHEGACDFQNAVQSVAAKG